MSLGDPSFQSPEQATDEPSRRPRILDDAADRWTMPIGRIAGTSVGLSYSVFFAAAIVVAVVLISARQPGSNSDLPRAAGLAVAFWCSGWLVQWITHFGVTRILGLPMRHVSIGLLGVDGAPRNWSASRTLMTALATVASLLVLGSLYRLVEGGFQMPVLSRSPTNSWVTPSIGFTEHDSIWKSGAWLCWVQAICQMYPLPRSMGRHIFGSLSSLCGDRLSRETQVMIFRRSLLVISLLTLCVGMYLYGQPSRPWVPRWPLVMLLGVMLWMSTRSSDLPLMVEGFASEEDPPRPSISATIREKVKEHQGQKRVKQAFDREREEAVDAARLDEILNRLHEHGQESLSEEDRQILSRVSENLRKERES
ncbi:MAG: hypothetical protein AB8B91_17665 [Rubripirellula sp.]